MRRSDKCKISFRCRTYYHLCTLPCRRKWTLYTYTLETAGSDNLSPDSNAVLCVPDNAALTVIRPVLVEYASCQISVNALLLSIRASFPNASLLAAIVPVIFSIGSRIVLKTLIRSKLRKTLCCRQFQINTYPVCKIPSP